MPSNINPNNIDGAYPVAGQDNNSQGFRDNFTNIKTNFQSAANELSELQSKVVLKSALSGSTLDNNMSGAVLQGARIQNFSATRNTIGSVTGAVTLDYTAGHYQTITTGGSVTLGFSSWPAASSFAWLRLQITVLSTDHLLILPASVSQNLASIPGISPGIAGQSNTIRFLTAGVYEFDFTTSNGGSTITITNLNGQPREQTLLLDQDIELVNTDAAQAALSSLAANLAPGVAYQFEAQYLISRSAGTNSHNIAVLFGYSGTFGPVSYIADATTSVDSPTPDDEVTAVRTVASSPMETVVTPTTGDASEFVTITMRGIIRTVGVSGVLVPQIKYSEAPGGAPTMLANSYFKIFPVGPNLVVPPV